MINNTVSLVVMYSKHTEQILLMFTVQLSDEEQEVNPAE